MAQHALSLRERKKQRTRAEIIEASKALFRRQGYEATTLEQVCAEVEISVPTLLSYFASKERLALAEDWYGFERVRARIEDRERSESTIAIWRSWVSETATWMEKNRRDQLKWLGFETGTPALVRARLALLQAYEDLLAGGIAVDVDSDPETDLSIRLTATTLAFGYRTVARQWLASRGTSDLVANANRAVDLAVEQLRVTYPQI
ncbi:MAG: TetR/AcrR family transcriptional regulator [Actinobacteria bacterium]|nr:TetR/AcrR family transcriptional regulator [Actinomycetota bacterium]